MATFDKDSAEESVPPAASVPGPLSASPAASAPAPMSGSSAEPVAASVQSDHIVSIAPTRIATVASCGDKPLTPCPLYAWMKANTSPAVATQDFGAMAFALDKVVTFAPAGYTNWSSIARDGASAARAQSFDGVRASCRGCHNQYREKYKREMRDKPIE